MSSEKETPQVLKLADIAESISIDPRKLTHYALDPDSPHGRHKAVLFEKLLGFTKDNHTVLLCQIESGAMRTEVAFHSEDRFGRRYMRTSRWREQRAAMLS